MKLNRILLSMAPMVLLYWMRAFKNILGLKE